MNVPFLDLARQHAELGTELSEASERVLAGGSYVLGPEVAAFEREWADFCGARASAGVASGTDALALALLASGAVRPGRGDEVITSPLTAGYTALAILNAGGAPVFADIDPRTYTLDPAEVDKALTPRTRAVVPVHLYGRMADVEGVCEVAARRGLVVVEDAAQAHGASSSGRRAGAHGHASAFSFYPTKNLGAYGDAGAVTSNDERIIARVRELRQGGHPAAADDELAGRNSRLDELQAALLRVKLRHLEDWNRRRRALAEDYGRRLNRGVVTQEARGDDAHVYHLFVVQHERRDLLREHLAARGVDTVIHYPSLLHRRPLFRAGHRRPLPVAERVAERILSLPLYPHLRAEELRAVAEAVNSFGP